MAKPGLENCHCGSKLYAPARYDGHGIFLTYACDTCWPTKLAGFREDIMEQYDADEPLDDEDGEAWSRRKQADHVDGFDRDDLGESPDY